MALARRFVWGFGEAIRRDQRYQPGRCRFAGM